MTARFDDLRNEVVGLLLDVRYDHKVTDRDMFKRAEKVIEAVLAPVAALAAEYEKDGGQVYAWDVAERLRDLP